MAAGGATATEMADILINKHRVTTDYASLKQKHLKMTRLHSFPIGRTELQ